jgi:hypothetical protein
VAIVSGKLGNYFDNPQRFGVRWQGERDTALDQVAINQSAVAVSLGRRAK